MRQGGAADALYVILRGEARVTQREARPAQRGARDLPAPRAAAPMGIWRSSTTEAAPSVSLRPSAAGRSRRPVGSVAAAGLSLLKLPGMFSQVLAVTSLDNFAKHRDGVKTIMRLPLFESLSRRSARRSPVR